MLMGYKRAIRKFILFIIGFIYSPVVRDYVEQGLNSLLTGSTSDVSRLSRLSSAESLDNPLLSALYIDPEIITV